MWAHTHTHQNLKITEEKENINKENMIQSDRNMNENYDSTYERIKLLSKRVSDYVKLNPVLYFLHEPVKWT